MLESPFWDSPLLLALQVPLTAALGDSQGVSSLRPVVGSVAMGRGLKVGGGCWDADVDTLLLLSHLLIFSSSPLSISASILPTTAVRCLVSFQHYVEHLEPGWKQEEGVNYSATAQTPSLLDFLSSKLFWLGFGSPSKKHPFSTRATQPSVVVLAASVSTAGGGDVGVGSYCPASQTSLGMQGVEPQIHPCSDNSLLGPSGHAVHTWAPPPMGLALCPLLGLPLNPWLGSVTPCRLSWADPGWSGVSCLGRTVGNFEGGDWASQAVSKSWPTK